MAKMCLTQRQIWYIIIILTTAALILSVIKRGTALQCRTNRVIRGTISHVAVEKWQNVHGVVTTKITKTDKRGAFATIRKQKRSNVHNINVIFMISTQVSNVEKAAVKSAPEHKSQK